MSKLADDLDDIRRRTEGMRDAITASNDNTTAALARIDEEVAALRGTDLSKEQKQHVDNIDGQLADIRTAVNSTGDSYKPRTQEPAPVKGVKGKPAPGSAADRAGGSI